MAMTVLKVYYHQDCVCVDQPGQVWVNFHDIWLEKLCRNNYPKIMYYLSFTLKVQLSVVIINNKKCF